MKRALLIFTLLCLLVPGAHQVQAQEYLSGYYGQYWDEPQLDARQDDPYYELDVIERAQLYPQQDDPYSELHAMHYQSYPPQFQSYRQYPYLYRRCCVPGR